MKTVIPVLVTTVISTGCATTDRADVDAEVAARQGAEVDRICFTRQIDGWRNLGRNAILVEKGVNEWFKLDLTGPCEPDLAFERIALRTRPPGGCLSKGDAVATFTTPTYGVCYITRMYSWDASTPVEASRQN